MQSGGSDLRQSDSRVQPVLPLADANEYTSMPSARSSVHEQQIGHRDVKPQNRIRVARESG